MEKEKILNDAVLVFLVKDGKVLLATKMKKIGKGRLNSYGGGIEKGETPLDAAIREFEEETRGQRETGIILQSKDIEKMAEMSFHDNTAEGISFICKVHIFVTRQWEGEIISTEDMADPKWYEIHNLPADRMIPGDIFWMPAVLSGKKIIGKAQYGPRQEKLVGEVEILEVSSF